MWNAKQASEIWDKVNDAEIEIKKILNRMNSRYSFINQHCVACNYATQKPFKPKKNLTENEQFLLEVLLNDRAEMKKRNPDRVLIPYKSNEGVWHYVCAHCAKDTH